MAWTYSLDFDSEGDPPKVFLHGPDEDSPACIEVLEEPTLQDGGDPSDDEHWSWDEDDWVLPPLAVALLEALNDGRVKP